MSVSPPLASQWRRNCSLGKEALSAQPAAAWVPVGAVHRQDCGGNPAWRGWIKLITLIMPPGDLKAA